MAESPSRSDILSLGAVVAVALLAGIGLGLLVDSAANTAPTFLLIGLVLGLVVGIAYAIGRFRTFLKAP